jgi:hypothetical protein
MKKALWCDHLGGHWADEKPCEMNACDCLRNAICPVCGYGWSTDNCECNQAGAYYTPSLRAGEPQDDVDREEIYATENV